MLEFLTISLSLSLSLSLFYTITDFRFWFTNLMLTEIVMKERNGQVIMHCFAEHASLQELRDQIDSSYEKKRNGKRGEKWYIPLPDPVDGSGRSLDTNEGYQTWTKYGQTKKIDAYLMGSAPDKTVPEPGNALNIYCRIHCLFASY